MNIIKNIGISIVLLIGGVILGYAMFSGGPATGGTTNYDDLSIDSITVSGASTLATITVSGETTVGVINSNGGQGSGVFATTTVATATLLASSITDYSYLAVTPADANTALTLPATSTLSDLIPNAGQCYTIKLENVSSVAATTTTIVAGAGMDLQEPDGQNVVIGGTSYANIEFCRRSDTDMVVTVDETIVAD